MTSKIIKKTLVSLIAMSIFGAGIYFITPYLKTNTKPKNWSGGSPTYVPARLKNTMNGMKKGF
tara:strand:- start:2212 stop:2400 length:189 start_codon:yes stop_codon:yes gene_type:complete